jgi:hypothetical protein
MARVSTVHDPGPVVCSHQHTSRRVATFHAVDFSGYSSRSRVGKTIKTRDNRPQRPVLRPSRFRLTGAGAVAYVETRGDGDASDKRGRIPMVRAHIAGQREFQAGSYGREGRGVIKVGYNASLSRWRSRVRAPSAPQEEGSPEVRESLGVFHLGDWRVVYLLRSEVR